jgi:hypothetical protein
MKPNRKIIEQKQMKEDMKKCPECAEIIKEEARVCRFCGYEFYKPDLSEDNPYTKNNIDIDEEEKIKKMKCPQCDFENEEGSKFCKKCNVLLSKSDYSEDNPYTKKNIDEDEEEKKTKKIVEEEMRAEARAEKAKIEKGNKKKSPLRTGCLVIFILFIIVSINIFYRAIDKNFSPTESTIPKTTSKDNYEKGPILLDGWKLERGEYDIVYITGIIENKSNKTYSYVQVEFNLYDENDFQVGSTIANVNNLEPNGKWKFKAVIMEAEAKKARFKAITSF